WPGRSTPASSRPTAPCAPGRRRAPCDRRTSSPSPTRSTAS
ncbi:MAG: hypothetical protein AVDCRST_MAG30-4347, partial [uncultured Solirubrobacteraceae bacterium]